MITSPAASNRLENFSSWLNAWLASHRAIFLSLVSLLYFLSAFGYYHVKTPDPDEVVYMWIVRMPTVHQIWAALLAGINIDPPLTQTAVHFLFRIFGDSLSVARLPETMGFWLLCLGAYLLISRHAPALYAAAALFVPLATTVRSQSIETRPYGLMVGCAMLAILCWDGANEALHQNRGRMRWLAGLAFSIAVCVSSHFFGTLVLFPLAIGELYKLLLRRRLDWSSYLAIAVGVSPLLFWLPILRAGAAVYGKHYFGPVSSDNLYLFYNNVLLLGGFAVTLLTACIIFAGSTSLRLPAINVELTERNRLLLAVTSAFLLIPVVGYTYALFVSHFFVPKYLMLSTFGVILGLPLALSIASARSLIVGLILFIAFGCHGLFIFSRGISGFARADGWEVTLADVEDASPRTKGDVVVASAIRFENLVYAGGPGSDRLIYLYDPAKAVQYSGTDSSDLVLKALDGQCPARFDTYDHYASAHKQFYILSAGPINGVNEWIMTHLSHTSAHLQYIKSYGMFDMFLVTLPDVTP